MWLNQGMTIPNSSYPKQLSDSSFSNETNGTTVDSQPVCSVGESDAVFPDGNWLVAAYLPADYRRRLVIYLHWF